MKNIKLTLAYDGTHLLGWQKTPFGPTVEEILEKALSQILQETVSLNAASRTDAGVHAEGQIVNFLTAKPSLNLSKLHCSLNALTPPSISIIKVEEAPLSFHSTLDSLGKKYQYQVCLSSYQLPKHRYFSWHFPYAIDLSLMQKASDLLLDTHDFSAFCNERSLLQKDPVCTLRAITLTPLEESRLSLTFLGDRFLFRMVRNLVGTLLYVGCGKLSIEEIPALFLHKKRALAGVTAPAQGLHLLHVFYP